MGIEPTFERRRFPFTGYRFGSEKYSEKSPATVGFHPPPFSRSVIKIRRSLRRKPPDRRRAAPRFGQRALCAEVLYEARRFRHLPSVSRRADPRFRTGSGTVSGSGCCCVRRSTSAPSDLFGCRRFRFLLGHVTDG